MKRRSMPKFKLRSVLIVLCGLMIGVFVYFANATAFVGNRLSMPFGYGAAVVLSGSMEPEFSEGDLIIVKESADYQPNDIVVFADGGSLVVHRIIAIDGETVTTKGDANNIPDKPIDKSRIKGTMVCVIGGVGSVVRILRRPLTIFIILTTALVLPGLSYRKKSNDKLDGIKAEIGKPRKDMTD